MCNLDAYISWKAPRNREAAPCSKYTDRSLWAIVGKALNRKSSGRTQETPPTNAPTVRRFAPQPPSKWTTRTQHLVLVYIILFILVTCAFVQLLLLRFFNYNFEVVVREAADSYVFLLLALLSFLIVSFVKVANTFPVNYTLSVVIVESAVCFIASYRWSKLDFGGALIIILFVLAINFVLISLGIWVPIKYLPGTMCVSVLTLCFAFVMVIIFVITYVKGDRYAIRYASMASLIYASIIFQFTITVVHQRRFDFLSQNNHVLQATTLAFLYVYMVYALFVTIRLGQFLMENV